MSLSTKPVPSVAIDLTHAHAVLPVVYLPDGKSRRVVGDLTDSQLADCVVYYSRRVEMESDSTSTSFIDRAKLAMLTEELRQRQTVSVPRARQKELFGDRPQ